MSLVLCISAVVHIAQFGVSVSPEERLVPSDLRTSAYCTKWVSLFFSPFHGSALGQPRKLSEFAGSSRHIFVNFRNLERETILHVE